jgi:predicted phage terminase large subunit-like protein
MNLPLQSPSYEHSLLQRLERNQTKRTIRKSLIEWCRYAGFEPARHHRLLIDSLEKITRGEIDRLAVFMPPGAAKSTYASILFTPWYLAQYPEHCVIAASHTQELAEKWGRRVRNLIGEHALILGCALASDSQAAGRWETGSGGEYFAAGVGGSITGRRADLVVIDDPVRSREDADSELIRDKTWDWYKTDLYTRLKPGGRIVLIQTRWHEDDLAGRLIAEQAAGGDAWHVISLPAIAELDDPLGRVPGEPLWPEWEGLADLERKKRAVDARNWSALYQQRPAPEEGDYFKAEWLRPYVTQPPLETLAVYGASDYAVTADGGDYTVHVVVGVDPDGHMYLLDLWRKQASSDVWVEAFCDLVRKYKPREWAEEQGQIKAGVGPFLDRMQRERSAFVYRRDFPVRADKAVRAQSIRGRMAQGGLFVPQGAGWFADMRSELLSFPAGKHDDIVDALGLIGQLLDTISSGNRPEPPVKSKNPSGYRTVASEAANNDWIAY